MIEPTQIPFTDVLVESLFRFIALISIKFPVADTLPALVSQVLCFPHITTLQKLHPTITTIELPRRIPSLHLGRHLQLVASKTLVRKVMQYDLMVYHASSPDIFLVCRE